MLKFSTGNRFMLPILVALILLGPYLLNGQGPSAPTGLVITKAAGDQVSLRWNMSLDEGVIKYRVLMDTSTAPVVLVDSTINIADTTITLTRPFSATPTYIRVTAVDNGLIESPYSLEVLVSSITEIATSIDGIQEGSGDWGDFDNDGDLDLVLAGFIGTDAARSRSVKIYQNDNGILVEIETNMIGMSYGFPSWGDYDNDGDLDLAISGSYSYNLFTTYIYRNDSGIFVVTDTLAGGSRPAWGDYDNDGDLDILISGSLYQNDASKFISKSAGISGNAGASIWGDYDNDGDLDVYSKSKVYQNNAGVFSNINASMAVYSTDYGAAWGDYDNDGDLDIAITGSLEGPCCAWYAGIYRNNNGVFEDINAGLPAFWSGTAEWGDYDNDGDLDLLLAGRQGGGTTWFGKIYLNENGLFTAIELPASNPVYPTANFADYDNDGDLDILMSYRFQFGGGGLDFKGITQLFSNAFTPPNVNPTAPGNLIASVGADSTINFSWSAATDPDNPSSSLTYNMRVGRTPGGIQIMAPYANAVTGKTSVVRMGNVQTSTVWHLKDLPLGRYYWSVQAVDHSYMGSEWAPEQEVITDIFPPDPPANLVVDSLNAGLTIIKWHQNLEADFLRYRVFRDTIPNPTTIIDSLSQISDTTISFAGLLDGISYYFRVTAVDTLLNESDYSNEIISVQPFITNIQASLSGVSNSAAAWGDYDNDGDLDLLIAGATATAQIAKLYRNDSGEFVDTFMPLAGLSSGSIAWGDYDNDGDLDILQAGADLAQVYRNDDSVFTNIGAGLIGVQFASVDWGDYDNDGDLDILLSGGATSGRITKVYQNDSGQFFDISAGLQGVSSGEASWGDYDNDGDLDILLIGDSGAGFISKVYRNNNGIFVDVSVPLTGVSTGATDWGDYDNDGDLDILLSGQSFDGIFNNISKIYRNEFGSFSDINAALIGLSNSAVAWVDYDNDGDLDVVLSGDTGGSGFVSAIYRNDNNQFIEIDSPLPGIRLGDIAWADFDHDGRQDVFLTGEDNEGTRLANIYHNTWNIINTAPTAPTGLNTTHSDSAITFSWSVATDQETPSNGLSYNIYVGSIANSGDIVSPMAVISTGIRKISHLGNAGHRLSWTLMSVESENYYWGVQAIDNGHLASPFTTGDLLTVNLPPSVPKGLTSEAGSGEASLTWRMNSEEDFLRYRIYGDTSPAPIMLIDSTSSIADTSIVIQALAIGVKYYFRVTAVDNAYAESDYSNEVSATTLDVLRQALLPEAFVLHQNYPNPFNPSTTIRFDLPVATEVHLAVYDLLGREVVRLVDGRLEAGYHQQVWDGKDRDGREVPTGIYFVLVVTPEFRESIKVVLLR